MPYLSGFLRQGHLTTSTNSSKNAEDANFDAYIARLQSQPSVDPHALAFMFDDRRYGYQAEIDQKNWWSFYPQMCVIMAVGLSNSTLKMFDVKNASWLADFEGHRELGGGPINCLLFSENGSSPATISTQFTVQEQLKISDSISNNGFSSDEQ
ncbi:hypothetical protein BY996DRAFT_6574699 [Phakopsora pachyrhizi]|uniref:Uncharacterized protein n=1 Tax=Phakopsora pachyrhizi TaxID=170000 RepID=A0AAV0ATF5_PHAPC|nr:hypothetical protein BY996DRAFT_6574699 [Phakopsora pachyrhizi]CAH7672248.1 hypothetical protein PPACK8108_LOCUS7057 [Phakopsora pachyrhizi]